MAGTKIGVREKGRRIVAEVARRLERGRAQISESSRWGSGVNLEILGRHRPGDESLGLGELLRVIQRKTRGVQTVDKGVCRQVKERVKVWSTVSILVTPSRSSFERTLRNAGSRHDSRIFLSCLRIIIQCSAFCV